MISDAPNFNHLWASLVVEELLRTGVETFVVTPGSRSTPLATAVANETRTNAVVHFDERGAAFFALGCGRATRKPTALICTSGTAVANLLPAVVEAANAQIPLILLTADRPPELIDTAANQTIDQNHIFGTYTRWSFLLPCPDRNLPAKFLLTTIDHAVHRASHPPAGPVHINCAFREPLAPTASSENFDDYLKPLANWFAGGRAYTVYDQPVLRLTDTTEHEIINAVTAAQRGLVVVGQLETSRERDAARDLVLALHWPTIADVASGLRSFSGACLPYADLALLSKKFQNDQQADLILWLGGALTSKRTAQYIEALLPTPLIRVADHPLRHDPLHRVTRRLEMDTYRFCRWLRASINPTKDGPWFESWRAANDHVEETVTSFFTAAEEVTEPGILRGIVEQAPANSIVFFGNSMPIRDADMFSGARDGGPWVIANRGASGIDGNIATVAGIARAGKKSVTAVLGDLAALHDLNSLALLRDVATPVVLVIINNDGGGIFHFLPVAEIGFAFERFFGTPHGLRFEHAAQMFDLHYAAPASIAEFATAYENALKLSRSTIIEVTTDRKANKQIHDSLFEAVQKSLDKS